MIARFGVEAITGSPVLDAGFAVRAAYLEDVYQTIKYCLAIDRNEIMKWEAAGRRMAYKKLAYSDTSKLPGKLKEFLAQLIRAGLFNE